METKYTQLVFVGHGTYATSIKTSIEMIVGEVNHIHFIDFEISDTQDLLTQKLTTTLDSLKDENVLIVTDIVGGAPFQIAAMMVMDKPHINVIGGANLSGILEVLFALNQEPSTIAKTMQETSIEMTKVLK